MKHQILFSSFILLCSLASCDMRIETHELPPATPDETPIEFTAVDSSHESQPASRVEEVELLSSFQASATFGNAGSESLTSETLNGWNSVTFTSDEEVTPTYSADKVWPSLTTQYNFYASNIALTFATGGTTCAPTGDSDSGYTDVVCAYKPKGEVTYRTKTALVFEHIYARVTAVKVTSISPYAISNVTIQLENIKTGGTYNLRTGSGQTDGTGWSSLTPAAPTNKTVYSYNTSVAAASYHTETCDVYIVPGDYRMIATWTATVGDYTKSFSSIPSSGTVSLVGGRRNTIEVSLTGDATAITFGVTVNAWSNNTADGGTFPTTNP